MNKLDLQPVDIEAPSISQSVYDGLRYRLVTGQIAPGVGISTRGLAHELGVSQMPVREALSRLAAEGAVEIRTKRKIIVPIMTQARLQEIMRCRLLLEPVAAANALPHISEARLRAIRDADHKIDAAIRSGEVDAYMESNFHFHSLINRSNPSDTFSRLVEMLWLQFGPFMRVVYARVGTASLVDQHHIAIQAIVDRDVDALHRAIADDISDGMILIRESDLGVDALSV